MAKKKQHHVVPHGDGWALKKAESQRPSAVRHTKEETVKVGRKITRNQRTELVIHKKDGKIQKSDSNGNDPNPPKDKK